MKSHANRVVLVTGAGKRHRPKVSPKPSHNMGRRSAFWISTERMPNERSRPCRDQGLTAHAYQADVVDFDAVSSCCADIEKALGPIDTIINNAGISPKRKGFA